MNDVKENSPLQNYDKIQEYLIIEVISPANKTFRIWMEIDTSILTKIKIQYQKEID